MEQFTVMLERPRKQTGSGTLPVKDVPASKSTSKRFNRASSVGTVPDMAALKLTSIAWRRVRLPYSVGIVPFKLFWPSFNASAWGKFSQSIGSTNNMVLIHVLSTHSALQVWKARWACFQRTRWNQRSVPTRYPQLPILLGVSPTACWRTLRIPLQHSKTWPWFARGFTLSICSPSTTRSEMLVGTCPLRLFSSKLSHPE